MNLPVRGWPPRTGHPIGLLHVGCRGHLRHYSYFNRDSSQDTVRSPKGLSRAAIVALAWAGVSGGYTNRLSLALPIP